MKATRSNRSPMRLTFRLVIACAFLITAVRPSLAAQLKPFDHASQVSSLVEHRTRLMAAVQARDFEGLRPFLAHNIQLSFGGHAGIAKAERFFKEQPELWDTLADVLRHGGGFQCSREADGRIFVAPYTFFAEAPPGLDVFEFVVLTGEGVAARARPSAGSPVLGRYSYEILPVDMTASSNEEWQGVKLPEGRTGYVAQKHVASPVDHRAGFQEIDGQWKMVFFLAGD